MKKVIFWSILFFISGFVQAQDFKADVMALVKVSGGDSGIELAKKQILPLVAEKNHASFLKEFEATLPQFWDSMAKIYMEEYTHDEVKELLKFYQSPIGKKMSEKAGVLAEKGMQAGQDWGMSLQPMVMKYMN
ncbi:MAG: DUF2059 domain-containing protein [Flavobacterium sp.]